jgi:hypothetical protein
MQVGAAAVQARAAAVQVAAAVVALVVIVLWPQQMELITEAQVAVAQVRLQIMMAAKVAKV